MHSLRLFAEQSGRQNASPYKTLSELDCHGLVLVRYLFAHEVEQD